MQQVNKKIDKEKQYAFPNNISIVRHKSKILVISVETGNWIVLENDSQLDFLYLLKANNLERALELFKGKQNDAVQTIIQLEARRFENQKISKTESKKVMLYLTNDCNMKCPHCYMYAGLKKDDELTCDEIITCLKELKKNGIKKVTFSGGEIATRSDIIEIINKTFELGYKIEILTNGVLWTDKMIDEVSSKIEKVQISIDGYNETENSFVRGAGNFEKALNTVDKFINHNVNTRIAVTPFFNDALESKIDNYADFANTLIKKYNGKQFDILFTGSLIKGREVDLNDEENEKYSKTIEKIYEKTIPLSREVVFIERHKKFEILDNCSFGNMNIASNGDVYACSRISEMMPFANIKKDDFEKIRHLSEKAKEVSNINNLEPCNKCELKYICGGGCRLIYFKKITESCDYNTLKVPPRICTQKEKEFFYDLMIKSNEAIFQ